MKKEKHTLAQRNKFKKVYITEVAIEKIPLIQYEGFTSEQNNLMQSLSKLVLKISKYENESNEIALTCNLNADNPLDEVAVVFGKEHEVDVAGDTLSNHYLLSCQALTVVTLHNHPTPQVMSLQDIKFFIHYESIQIMVVVTNQGNVYYIRKTNTYNHQEAAKLLNSLMPRFSETPTIDDYYKATKKFLKSCYKAGIHYGQGR